MDGNKPLANRVTRRQLLLGMSAAGLGAALSACAPATPTQAPSGAQAPAPAGTQAPAVIKSGGKPKLSMVVRSFFGPDTDATFKAQAEGWGKNNNVDVTCDVISMNDIPTKVAAAAEAGAGPDIIHLFDGTPFLYTDKLADVSDVAASIEKESGGFYDLAKQVCVVDGVWRAMPHTGTTHLLVYRSDLFQQFNLQLPDTWDQLLEVGKTLRQNKYLVGWPIAHAAGDGNTFMYSILWSYGAKEVQQDGKTLAIDSPETIKCLQMIKRLYEEAFDPAATSWDDSANNRLVLAGQMALTGNSSSIYNASFKDAPQLTDKIAHGIYPQGPGGRHLRAETQSFGLFKYCKAQDEAKALLKYMMSKEQYGKWITAASGDRVGMTKNMADLEIWKNPKLKPVMDSMAFAHMNGYPGPVTRTAAESFNNFTLIDMATMVIKGSKPEDAVKWAVDQYKAMLAKG